MLFSIQTQVQEDAVIPELQVAVDEADLPAEFSMEGDGGVDRDGRRTHPALRPIQGEHPTHRRSRQEDVSGGEARQEALDPGKQLGRMEGLDEVVVRTGSQSADLLLHLSLGGEHDDRDMRGAALFTPDLGRHLVAVKLGQQDIEQDEIGCFRAPQSEPLRPVGGGDDVIAFLLQRVLQEPLDIRVVIDDQDLGRHRSSACLAGKAGCRLRTPGPAIIGTMTDGPTTARSAVRRWPEWGMLQQRRSGAAL